MNAPDPAGGAPLPASGHRHEPDAALRRTLRGGLIDENGDVVSLDVTFRYLRRDPFAVTLSFPVPGASRPPVVWVIGRELLATGLTRWSGEGAVHVFPAGPTSTVLELTDPTGHAVIVFETWELHRFVAHAHCMVPPGGEGRYLDVDGCVADLLGNA